MTSRLAGLLAALLLAASSPAPLAAAAGDAGYPPEEPYPVALRVGETFEVCKSGQVQCPARVPICDDPKVAEPADGADGLVFRGVAPGTTLCSALASNGQRRVFRITVR